MQPHEERVVLEKKELDEKLEKLYHFVVIPNEKFKTLDAFDQHLLTEQYFKMYQYSEILGQRISRFKK